MPDVVVGVKGVDADVNGAELGAFVCRLKGTVGVNVAGVCSATAVAVVPDSLSV